MHWHKSTHSYVNGCVEVAFAKSSHSGMNGCVEVLKWTPGDGARTTGCFQCPRTDVHVHLRDTDDPATVTTHTAESWRAFLAGARDGEFDLP